MLLCDQYFIFFQMEKCSNIGNVPYKMPCCVQKDVAYKRAGVAETERKSITLGKR